MEEKTINTGIDQQPQAPKKGLDNKTALLVLLALVLVLAGVGVFVLKSPKGATTSQKPSVDIPRAMESEKTVDDGQKTDTGVIDEISKEIDNLNKQDIDADFDASDFDSLNQ